MAAEAILCALPPVDHPNAIAGLRFRLFVSFSSRAAQPRRRRAPAAG
jgi:hypothetical protein